MRSETVVCPLFLAGHQRNEPDRQNVPLFDAAVRPLGDEQQVLHFPAVADGDHHPSAGLELLDERPRHVRRRRRDHDAVKGAFSGQPL